METIEAVRATALPSVQQAAEVAVRSDARQLTVIEHAIRSGANPEQLQALLELQVRADSHQLEMLREKRRMDEEDRLAAAKRAFDEAMAAFRAENIIVPKTKSVHQAGREGKVGPSFAQAEFDVVCRLISPALAAVGLSFRHDQKYGSKKWMTDGLESDVPWVYVKCILTHKLGYSETLTLEGPPWETGSMNDLQRMSASGSFMKRVSLLSITGTATAEEDDEARRLVAKGGKAGEHGEAGADPLAALREAGKEAAKLGLEALNGWWGGLTGRQRNQLTADFRDMRKTAQGVAK